MNKCVRIQRRIVLPVTRASCPRKEHKLQVIESKLRRNVLNHHNDSMALQSASGPYLSSDRRLSTKLVPTFADRGCHVVRAANPHGRNFDFLDRSSSIVLTRLSGPRSRPTAAQKICSARKSNPGHTCICGQKL
jgi:hypothetical protein